MKLSFYLLLQGFLLVLGLILSHSPSALQGQEINSKRSEKSNSLSERLEKFKETYILRGFTDSNDPHLKSVFIESRKTGKQELYFIGDQIEGVTIKNLNADKKKVLLNEGSQSIELTLQSPVPTQKPSSEGEVDKDCSRLHTLWLRKRKLDAQKQAEESKLSKTHQGKGEVCSSFGICIEDSKAKSKPLKRNQDVLAKEDTRSWMKTPKLSPSSLAPMLSKLRSEKSIQQDMGNKKDDQISHQQVITKHMETLLPNRLSYQYIRTGQKTFGISDGNSFFCPLKGWLQKDTTFYVKMNGIRSLGELGNEVLETYVQKYFETFKSIFEEAVHSYLSFYEFLKATKDIKLPQAVPLLKSLLQNKEANSTSRWLAMYALAVQGAKEITPIITELFYEQPPKRTPGENGYDYDHPAKPDWMFRSASLKALAALGDAASVRTMMDEPCKTGNFYCYDFSKARLWVIGKLKMGDRKEELWDALEKGQNNLWTEALYALGQLATHDDMPRLIHFLKKELFGASGHFIGGNLRSYDNLLNESYQSSWSQALPIIEKLTGKKFKGTEEEQRQTWLHEFEKNQ